MLPALSESYKVAYQIAQCKKRKETFYLILMDYFDIYLILSFLNFDISSILMYFNIYSILIC